MTLILESHLESLGGGPHWTRTEKLIKGIWIDCSEQRIHFGWVCAGHFRENPGNGFAWIRLLWIEACVKGVSCLVKDDAIFD
jgi:hypothetical protein